MASTPNIYKLTRPAVMIWPHLYEARAYKDPKTGRLAEPKFDATFMFTDGHGDLAPMKQFLVWLAKQHLPAGWDLKQLGQLLTSGTKRADAAKAKEPPRDLEFMRGTALMQAKTGEKYPPRLSVVHPGKGVVDYFDAALRPTAKEYFYSGVQVIVEFNFQPYEGFGGGVTAYLNHILSTNKGERLASGPDTADKFSEYLGTITNEDPSAGMSEEIPF